MLRALTIFTVLIFSPWAFAKDSYVCSGKPLDPLSMVRLGSSFAKDSFRVCYFDQELKGLNPADLTVRRGGVATDGRRVYVQTSEVRGVDPMTFQYIGYRYYRDARRVYLREGPQLRALEGIDPDTFQLHGAYYTSDKSGVYWNGFRVLAADRRTFQVTSLHSAKDRYRSFIKGVSVRP